ncbi:HAD family hydrolase [Halobaculum lipolyticum]|uniref:HAD family hydrolase n=1 Tax=Halobaculum lipolyticum TaxID=3032001 RepID=A0ABD5WGX7_9EURY|nr:HAD family hydrolase [Halobaculum sp. DT31]
MGGAGPRSGTGAADRAGDADGDTSGDGAGAGVRDGAGGAAVSFDLFGTLVEAERPSDPAAAVAAELRDRGVAVPDDWADAYAEPHLPSEPGVERPLHHHVAAALASRTAVEAREVVDDAAAAVGAAFDRPVRTREGAVDAVAALAERGPVGVCSNCSVPGLVARTLDRSALDPASFDAVTASVACGRRKPDRGAFAAVAAGLGVSVDRLVHVGDDRATDGAVAEYGGHAVFVDEVPLPEVPAHVEARWG